MNRRPANPVLILPALVTRRVIATASGSVTNAYVYDGYLQIADSDGNACVWDPTEPVATRPLARVRDGSAHFFTHDGNKNVSELADGSGTVAAHYEYAPFGEVTFSSGDLAAANPFRFSSEYADDTLGLVYYNYRHLNPLDGRWMSRDLFEEKFSLGLYLFCDNLNLQFDNLGTMPKVQPMGTSPTVDDSGILWFAVAFDGVNVHAKLFVVKHLKINLTECKSGKQLLSDGKEWSEEVSMSKPNPASHFTMTDGSKPMTSLIMISPPGEKNCRDGKIELSSDFFFERHPHIFPERN